MVYNIPKFVLNIPKFVLNIYSRKTQKDTFYTLLTLFCVKIVVFDSSIDVF